MSQTTEKRLRFTFEWIRAFSDLGPKVVKILSIKEGQWLDSDTNALYVLVLVWGNSMALKNPWGGVMWKNPDNSDECCVKHSDGYLALLCFSLINGIKENDEYSRI